MRGKKISTDLKTTIIALGSLHSVSEIEGLMAVSRCQIYCIQKTWQTMGSVEPEYAGRKTGRPRFLSQDEEVVSFLLSLTEQLLMRCIASMWLRVFEERLTYTLRTFKPKLRPI